MSRAHLAAGAAISFALAGLCALALCTACGPAPADISIHGQMTNALWEQVARALPHMPAEPWPCVRTIVLGEACPGDEGCYWPDSLGIETQPAALAHELLHAAMECAYGDPDYGHTRPEWAEVDGAREP